MPRARQSTRTTTAAFTAEQTESFLAGQWVAVESQWLYGAQWSEAESRLTFGIARGGGTESIWADRARAEAFAQAPSKGGFIFDVGWRPRGR
jgi:hypothetical protein